METRTEFTDLGRKILFISILEGCKTHPEGYGLAVELEYVSEVAQRCLEGVLRDFETTVLELEAKIEEVQGQ